MFFITCASLAWPHLTFPEGSIVSTIKHHYKLIVGTVPFHLTEQCAVGISKVVNFRTNASRESSRAFMVQSELHFACCQLTTFSPPLEAVKMETT